MTLVRNPGRDDHGGNNNINHPLKNDINREVTAAFVKNWIEKVAASKFPFNSGGTQEGGSFYENLTLHGVQVLHVGAGLLRCNLSVSDYLTDGDGNWSAGAIAGLIDNICSFTVVTLTEAPNVSVDLEVTYLSPVKIQENVVMEGKVLFNKGKLWCVLVEIKKADNGELVAIGRQWMSSVPRNYSRL